MYLGWIMPSHRFETCTTKHTQQLALTCNQVWFTLLLRTAPAVDFGLQRMMAKNPHPPERTTHQTHNRRSPQSPLPSHCSFIFPPQILSLLSGWQVSGGLFSCLTSLWGFARVTKDPARKRVEIASCFSLPAEPFPPGRPALPTARKVRKLKYKLQIQDGGMQGSREESGSVWTKSVSAWGKDWAHPGVCVWVFLKCLCLKDICHSDIFPQTLALLFLLCETTCVMFLKLSLPQTRIPRQKRTHRWWPLIFVFW